MAQAIYVITAAVDRYKELCEGKYIGGCAGAAPAGPAALMGGCVAANLLHAKAGDRCALCVCSFDTLWPERHDGRRNAVAEQALPPRPLPRPRPGTPGQAVPRIQRVLGVEFSYQPPPKCTVPYAASLKGTHLGPPGQR